MKGQNKNPYLHVTAGLMWKHGTVLIAKRPKGAHLEGFWEFPGGKREKGESLKDCLEREIEEELGVKVKAGEELLTVEHEYGTKAVSLHVFNCTCFEGEPKCLQVQDIRWVEPAGLGKYTFPPPDEKVIEFLLRGRVLGGVS
jgi:8-oxo-dGTP diphosphatase